MNRSTVRLRRRADYTHAFNAGAGRHGWLRLTPAYSRQIVEEILAQYAGRRRVLDPFCGTGTTALVASSLGHGAVTSDINPFLLWLTRAKTANYRSREIDSARRTGIEATRIAIEKSIPPAPVPRIHNIDRWWSRDDIAFLARLKAAINSLVEPNSPSRNLLELAFCRLVVQLSNASFGHQSMSFRQPPSRLLPPPDDRGYVRQMDSILRSACENPVGPVRVVLEDARHLRHEALGVSDLVITSPPYANRMSYIRELRPYMYWLDFVREPRETGELDWQAVGGTWGVATSRLHRWQADPRLAPSLLEPILAKIRTVDRPHAKVLAQYVAKYFEDMTHHFMSLRRVLLPGSAVHYIVGNSVFYGVLTPTELIYEEILRKCGFDNVVVRAIRKRNSKRELIEFEIAAIWP